MLEIYNEQVRDLLNPASLKIKGGLKIRQHPNKGFYGEKSSVMWFCVVQLLHCYNCLSCAPPCVSPEVKTRVKGGLGLVLCSAQERRRSE